jgi:hypothetical protein
MELGMMVFGIVCNDNDATTASRTYSPKMFEKRMERHGVKPFLLSLKSQFSVTQTDSSKIAHALTSGMVQQYRVLLLGRHPHQAA